ncbi:MAG: nucleotidyltransferase domain-containing protein [Arenimonas sp.]|nr:nucleotidyltransferase domain-containing protein [Rhizobium sp.]MBW8448167.1 nucleotidyltransferase domain-containing protein [Arenimonas sp.]
MNYLESRRVSCEEKINILRSELSDAGVILGGDACIYATGSFGRLEAGKNSDLDIFIISKTIEKRRGEHTVKVPQLSQLNTILVKAELIKAVRKLDMPDFDSDGRYLASHTVSDLVESLGAPDDDYKNTLTGRLLLFLESQPLLGQDVYDEIIGEVIAAYFGDYSGHSDGFMPAFLANDILRLWRTFCVNYEFGRRGEKIADKLKNFKLKHSRMLTCYSALIYLLAVFRLEKTVSIDRAKEMAKLTPTKRLEWIKGNPDLRDCHDVTNRLLERYSEFLQMTDLPKEELWLKFEENNKDWARRSYEFGDMVAEALVCVGDNSRFYRLISV